MTAAKSSRINARLPPELARKAAYLERRLNLSTTEVLKEAIERLYESVHDERGHAEELLTSAGFLGCADGPEALSTEYKSELRRSLDLKVRERRARGRAK